MAAQAEAIELRQAALDCLAEADPVRKCERTRALAAARGRAEIRLAPAQPLSVPARPGRPERPELVTVNRLAARGLGSHEGRAAFLHAIAHIEFNAINLAWDAVARFAGMPERFYDDWARVADDEARHFQLVLARLLDFGHSYGDFPAHDGLWEMAMRTAHSCLERMALVPRVLEARGLDVTPAMIDKLSHLGDHASAEVLAVILREEVAHVEIGSRWFHWCCDQAGVEPMATFRQLLQQHARPLLRGPFNHPARIAAGFSECELVMLDQIVSAGR